MDSITASIVMAACISAFMTIDRDRQSSAAHPLPIFVIVGSCSLAWGLSEGHGRSGVLLLALTPLGAAWGVSLACERFKFPQRSRLRTALLSAFAILFVVGWLVSVPASDLLD